MLNVLIKQQYYSLILTGLSTGGYSFDISLKAPTHDQRQKRFAPAVPLFSYGESAGARLSGTATLSVAHRSDLPLTAALKVKIT